MLTLNGVPVPEDNGLISYASMWFHGAATTETITTQNFYTKVTIFDADGLADDNTNVVPDSTTDNDMTINMAGTYEVSIQASFTNDGGGTAEFQMGCARILLTAKTITDATFATPIVVTHAAHGYQSGDGVRISGVAGNTNANGDWVVTVLTADTYSLQDLSHVDSAGNAGYTSGGQVDNEYPGEVKMERIVSNLSLGRGAAIGRVKLVVGDVLEAFVANQDGVDNLLIEQIAFQCQRIAS